MKVARSSARVAVAIVGLATLQCTDNPLATNPKRDLKRSTAFGTLPAGIQFTVSAGPTSIGGGMGATFTGVSLPPGAQARIVAAGDLSAPHNPLCSASTTGWMVDPVTPMGTINSEGAVFVYKTGFSPEPTGWSPIASGRYVHYELNPDYNRDTVGIWAQRKGFNYSCVTDDNPPAFTYMQSVVGSTTLTIDVLGVDVSTSTTKINQGQSISATAVPRNFPLGGTTSWYLDTAVYTQEINIPACSNLTTCTFIPTKSGRLVACINDEYGTATCGYGASFFVVKCPTGDTLLDNPVFRNALLQALRDSKADSADFTRRREVGGYAYFDSLGMHVRRTEDPVLSTPCSVAYSGAANEVLIFHIHPFNPTEGFRPADIFPNNCGLVSGFRYDDKTWGGPSPDDWRSSVNEGKPSYVFDKKRIYVTNPAITDSTQWKNATKRYDWNTGKCKW